MLASSSTALLVLVLLGTPATARTCPPPGAMEGRCIELTANPTEEVSEAQLSPGQPTTFHFDSDVRADGVTLENREHFEVASGSQLITLEPSERMRGAQPGRLRVCFADGAAPGCASFRLLFHPVMGERRVEVFRHPRTMDSVQAELKKTREENARLRAENERLRVERDRPDGLTGLLSSGMVGQAGMPSQSLTRYITKRESNTLRPRLVTTFRAPGRVAIDLMVENLDAAKSWALQGAKLVGPKGEVLEATFFPAESIPPGEWGRVWIEVMAQETQTVGPFTLKVWEADGQRTFVIGNVTFPDFPTVEGR